MKLEDKIAIIPLRTRKIEMSRINKPLGHRFSYKLDNGNGNPRTWRKKEAETIQRIYDKSLCNFDEKQGLFLLERKTEIVVKR